MSCRALPPRRTSSLRPRALLAAPLLAAVLAGCGTSGSNTTTNVTATGSTLSVYLSEPATLSSDPTLADVGRAEQLAWQERSPAVTNVSLRKRVVTASASANARTAIADTSLIAYVGEIATGQSRQTVGITNAEDVLELSPTDTVVPGKNDFESLSTYGRTFASLPIQLTTSPAALNRADPTFAKSFKAQFGHSPSAEAIEGYDAVWVLLRVIAALGNRANSRSKVTASVIATLKANAGQASVPAFTIKK